MVFELITYNDLDEIRGLQPEDWSDITPDFEFYIRSSFCKAIKVREKKTIVGIGSLIIFHGTSWIGHMIVGKNFRNRGIGYQIVEKLLEDVKNNSIETCSLIASDMGRPVYLKAGFRDVTEYCFMKRAELWSPGSKNPNVISFREEHRSMVYALDSNVSGENRERLLADFLHNCKVYYKNGIVEGFYLPDLKEGPIIANTEEAGLALMEIKYHSGENATLPSENFAGKKFLENNGFVKRDKRGTRMVYGKEINWKPEKMYSRIGGNLG